METAAEPPAKEEEFTYSMIINALSEGLYPYRFHIIREYIQNSCDAIKEWAETHDISDCSVKVDVKGSSIFVYDNATGMTHEKIGQYRYLGFSKKRYGDYAGYRGIGSAAAIGIAEEIIVTTSPYGVPERYILTIKAGEMRRQVEDERKRGEVSSVRELMKKYTEVVTDPEDLDKHYTLVELRGIRDNAKDLLDQNHLMVYLATDTPVPFHPEFKTEKKHFGEEIEAKLKENVPDYQPFKIFVGNEQVYKMYRAQWGPDEDPLTIKEPVYVEILDSGGNLMAYCWYCAKTGTGQIEKPLIYKNRIVDIAGLLFKLKGFAIGNKGYLRNNIWQNNDNLAYWYLGEIHVCDENVEPTSERSGFVDSPATTALFNECWKAVGKQLNKKAHKLSDKSRAVEVIENASSDIAMLQQEVEKGIVKDVLPAKQAQLHEIISAVREKKKKDIEETMKQKADEVVEKSKRLLRTLSGDENQDVHASPSLPSENKIIDVPKELGFDDQAARVYGTMMVTLRDYFAGDLDGYERLINSIVDRLRQEFGNL